MVLARWLVWALATLVLWGFWGVLAKRASELEPVWYRVYVASNSAIVAGVALILAARGVDALPSSREAFAVAFAAGSLGTLGYVFFVKALTSGGPAGVVVPLTSLYPALTFTLSAALLGERVTPLKAAGVALAVAAVVLLSIEE